MVIASASGGSSSPAGTPRRVDEDAEQQQRQRRRARAAGWRRPPPVCTPWTVQLVGQDAGVVVDRARARTAGEGVPHPEGAESRLDLQPATGLLGDEAEDVGATAEQRSTPPRMTAEATAAATGDTRTRDGTAMMTAATSAAGHTLIQVATASSTPASRGAVARHSSPTTATGDGDGVDAAQGDRAEQRAGARATTTRRARPGDRARRP